MLTAIVAVIVMIWLPLKEGRAENLNLLSIYLDPFILYEYVASVVFFFALFKAFRLLGLIGRDNVFSHDAVRFVRSIKYCSLILSIEIVVAGIYIQLFHSTEDDPAGFLAICVVLTFISVVAATLAAVFERILQNGIDLKSENELLHTDKLR